MSVELFFHGRKSKEYRGWDQGTEKTVRILKGCPVIVSEIKAEQLLKDYPQEFEQVKKATPVSAVIESFQPEQKKKSRKGK